MSRLCLHPLKGLAGCCGVGVQDGGVPGCGLEDEAGVAGEANVAATLDPAFVDGNGCAVIADAGGDVGLAGGGSDDEADDAETVGGDSVLAESAAVAVVLVEGPGGEGEEDEGDEELILRLGLDLAFGVEGELLVGVGVCSGEGGLNGLCDSGGEDELAELEVECTGAAEASGWLGLGDLADHGGADGDGDGVVGVVDGLGYGGFDLLPGFGGGGAELVAEVGLDDPGFGGGVGWGGRVGGRGCGDFADLRREGEGLGGFDRPGGVFFDALGMVGELSVEELGGAVAFVKAGDDGELVAEDLDSVVPPLVNETAFAGRRRDEAVDGGAVGGGASGNGKGRAVGEGDAGEADDGCPEGSEVATKPGADAAGVVGVECSYSTRDDGFGWEDEGVVYVDGVDELGTDGLANAHGEMILDLDRKRCPCG
jgi:hypothetical protein